jgi:hypothetical protein
VIEMASTGTKIKEAATKAAKDKGSGDKKGKKDKRTGGSESGVDKAKRAVTNRLK